MPKDRMCNLEEKRAYENELRCYKRRKKANSVKFRSEHGIDS